jgi:hypothetical protein
VTPTQYARDAAPPRPAAPRPIAAHGDPTLRPHRTLRCAACSRDITDESAAIDVHGAHDHHFVNPHGHAFHVGIFKYAPGGQLVGPLVAFYSWFPGLPWQLAVCGGCHAHLGWGFGAAAEFYALILERLRHD